MLMAPDTGGVHRPLDGATILVTRAPDRSARLTAALEALGATVVSYSATRIEPRDLDGLAAAARQLARYDWVVFTSATAVSLLFDATVSCGVGTAAWAFTKVAVVGSATASAVRAHGVEPAVIPDRFVAEGLLEALALRNDVRDARLLYPVAAGARAQLIDGLRALGATVDRIEAYESVAGDDDVEHVRTTLESSQVTLVTLTASSAVTAYVAAMDPMHRFTDAVSIGPITSDTARAAGIRVIAEADPSTVDGLVDAVVRAVTDKRARLFSQTLLP